jgi:hypothetical protein
VPAANVASDVCHRTSDAAVTGNNINAHTAAAEATARLNAKTMNPPYATRVDRSPAEWPGHVWSCLRGTPEALKQVARGAKRPRVEDA